MKRHTVFKTYFQIFLKLYTLTKFHHWKIFRKKIAAISKWQQIITHFGNFEQVFRQNL